MDKDVIENIFKKFQIEKSVRNISKDKLIDLFEYLHIDMGKPIILAEEIPKHIFILLEGKVRQLFENPLKKEIMTLTNGMKSY